jgi:HEAT repeat protein
MLTSACETDKTGVRATAVGALGLLSHNARARLMAEKALADEKPEVRTAAAASLGEMGARASIPKLKDATDDPEPTVVLAAAHSLIQLHDHFGYEVYYEILTGERKGSKGLIASQTAILKDPKKMAVL